MCVSRNQEKVPDPQSGEMYHFFAKEIKPLQSPQSLRASLNVAIHDMCLTAHLHRLQGYHVEHWTIRREQCIQRKAEVLFLKPIGKVGTVETKWRLFVYDRSMQYY